MAYRTSDMALSSGVELRDSVGGGNRWGPSIVRCDSEGSGCEGSIGDSPSSSCSHWTERS
jgi:hypothetical protein